MFGIDHIDQLNLILIYGVGESDHSLLCAVGQSRGLVILISKESGLVSIGMVDMDCRFVIILHTVSDESLGAIGNLAVVGLILQFLTEITLIETIIVGNVIHEGVVVGLDHN